MSVESVFNLADIFLGELMSIRRAPNHRESSRGAEALAANHAPGRLVQECASGFGPLRLDGDYTTRPCLDRIA